MFDFSRFTPGDSSQNSADAARERDRRQAALSTGELDPFVAAQQTYLGPAWDAFYGALHQKAEDANAAGMDFSIRQPASLQALPSAFENLIVAPGSVRALKGQR